MESSLLRTLSRRSALVEHHRRSTVSTRNQFKEEGSMPNGEGEKLPTTRRVMLAMTLATVGAGSRDLGVFGP